MDSMPCHVPVVSIAPVSIAPVPIAPVSIPDMPQLTPQIEASVRGVEVMVRSFMIQVRLEKAIRFADADLPL